MVYLCVSQKNVEKREMREQKAQEEQAEEEAEEVEEAKESGPYKLYTSGLRFPFPLYPAVVSLSGVFI